MTTKSDLKKRIRERQRRTGESFTTSRLHVLRDRAELLGIPLDAGDRDVDAAPPIRVEAIVLKVNDQSARVRVIGEQGEVTFRTSDIWGIVPGHVASLVIERRWTWRGDSYASGRIEKAAIDVEKLGLDPLPLDGGQSVDLREGREP